jgi:response regulator RpfG family c-di-GMP phosphodiesterase
VNKETVARVLVAAQGTELLSVCQHAAQCLAMEQSAPPGLNGWAAAAWEVVPLAAPRESEPDGWSIAEPQHCLMVWIETRSMPSERLLLAVTHLWTCVPQLPVVLCMESIDSEVFQMVVRLGCPPHLFTYKRPWSVAEACLLLVAAARHRHGNQGGKDAEQQRLLETQRTIESLERTQRELVQAEGLARRQNSELGRLVRSLATELTVTRDAAVLALAKLAESRDNEIGGHIERIRAYSQVLAEHLSQHGPYQDQVDEHFLADLYRSSPLHDIGKVGIPDSVLLKPGRLTPQEFSLMQRHTDIGADALAQAARDSGYTGFLIMAADVARFHHERFDGKGYPRGLAGQQIPLAARIVALADVYDALTSPRIYKNAYDPYVARRMILEESGKQFDPAIVEAFEANFHRFLEIGASLPPHEPAPARPGARAFPLRLDAPAVVELPLP